MTEWYEKAYPGGPPVGPPLIRPLYPPDSGKGSTPGKDVIAVKRAISRGGRWPWQEFDPNFSNGISHGTGGNVVNTGLAGVQRQNGIDDTGWMGEKTYNLLRYARVPVGLPNAGEPLFDATAVRLLYEFAAEYHGAPPDYGVREPRVYLCEEWGARSPNGLIIPVHSAPNKALFHHTDGHHPEISNPDDESLEELFRYARDIQYFHMYGAGRGWVDSGHNYLIGLNGVICEGRHGSHAAIKKGEMVVSAHCPEQNTNPGIEHEHKSEAKMSAAQWNASVQLYAWIGEMCGIPTDKLARPHSQYYPTACPDELTDDLPMLRVAIAQLRD